MTRRGVLAIAVVAVLAAAAFRGVHLGTPSLWWDELVHMEIAARPPALLLSTIKWGPHPQAPGNAGAMPLDYVLLHLYQSVTPAPAPERLEAYWRLPAYLYSVAAVAAVVVLLGRDGGVAAAAVGGTLLALSVPAAVYAAEVRPYSLVVLLAALHLLALRRVVAAWTDRRAWLAFAAVTSLFVAASLTAIPVVVASALVLLAFAIRGRRAAVAAAGLGGTAVLVAVAVLAYFRGVDITAGLGRVTPADPDVVARTLAFLATGEYDRPGAVLLAAVAPGLAILHATRRAPRALPLLAFAIASFAALPVLVVLIRWKAYYFHVRHALVLLPAAVVVLTHACLGAGDVLARGRPRPAAVVAAALAAALALPPAAAFVHDPYRYFRWTKTVQDWKSVAGRLASEPGGRALLLVAESRTREHERASYLGAWYLRARGLDGRVLFCTTADLAGAAARLAEARRVSELDLLGFGCTSVLGLERPGPAVEARTSLGALADRRILPAGVRDGHPGPPPDIGRFAFVSFGAATSVPARDVVHFPGLVLAER